MIRRLLHTVMVASALVALGGCMGHEKGNGLDRLDTISKEDKEEDAWFKSFYGKNHCGVWEGACKPGEDSDVGGGGGGGMWGGGVGPSDSGASHDSGSY